MLCEWTTYDIFEVNNNDDEDQPPVLTPSVPATQTTTMPTMPQITRNRASTNNLFAADSLNASIAAVIAASQPIIPDNYAENLQSSLTMKKDLRGTVTVTHHTEHHYTQKNYCHI
uniref:Uncharacterized protein n=1 Tax=Plectus sambesii TaxID=2011161 RepID=A0A914UXJ4_9BILA